jgi:hypothetical protein
MNRLIVGFTGRIGAGKSEAAARLHRKGFTRTRFAGPLKDMMRVLGMTDDEIEGSRKELPCDLIGGKTPRYAMQTIGTEWGRDLMSENIWVDAWKRKVSVLTSSVTVEDVRFLNEAVAVRQVGGILVRIERPDMPSIASTSLHVSEEMDFVPDLIIHNDGTRVQLFDKIDMLTRLTYSPEGRPQMASVFA